jgi:hypothetical protein
VAHDIPYFVLALDSVNEIVLSRGAVLAEANSVSGMSIVQSQASEDHSLGGALARLMALPHDCVAR